MLFILILFFFKICQIPEQFCNLFKKLLTKLVKSLRDLIQISSYQIAETNIFLSNSSMKFGALSFNNFSTKVGSI